MSRQYTISRYLIERMRSIGIGHLFGVPGDYVLDFLDEVNAGPIQWVGTCNELNAGYAADGYARINGIGGAVVTYGVGGLSILNAVAGAFAEHVPLIVVSGAPPSRRRETGALVHHLIAGYDLQLEIFRKVTVDTAILTNPDTAPGEIDRVVASCLARKQPVYLELPSDLAHAPCRAPLKLPDTAPAVSDAASLAECVEECAALLNRAAHPLLLVGTELPRLGLGNEALRLVEATELPFATMLSSKAVLPELHPQFVGIYQGAWSREVVRQQVEQADCLLTLGVWITDLDTGLFSMDIDQRRMIAATNGQVRVRNHYYHQIQMADFIGELSRKIEPRSYLISHPSVARQPKIPFIPAPSRELTAARLYECLDSYLDDQMVLLAEPGDAFCAAPEFNIEEAQNFIVQTYYCSIGFTTPAALGVALACPEKRPVVLTGDGAFQMTVQEVSSLIRERCPALIVIINNDGYLIERMLHTDGPYNDIQMWRYSMIPETFNAGDFALSFSVATEEELARAMQLAVDAKDKLVLIEAIVPQMSCSTGLERLGKAFREAACEKTYSRQT